MSRFVFALVILSLVLPACGDDASQTGPRGSGGKPVVLTTFYPTTYFASRLAGDDAEVICPVPEDEDPIFYEPPADVVARYQAADLIVVNGAEFEKWVLRTSLPESRIVDTARPFEDRWLRFKKAVEHSHGPSGKHTHRGIDGHTWLDPENAKIQSAEIAKGLTRILPDRAAAIEKRLEALHADLDGLGAAWTEASKAYAGEVIYASHPAYNYVAKRYEWAIENLDLDPETMPEEKVFDEVKSRLAERPARYLIWESAPKPEIAKRFHDGLGLVSLVVSPCEMPGDLDYLAQMHKNVETMKPALTPGD